MNRDEIQTGTKRKNPFGEVGPFEPEDTEHTEHLITDGHDVHPTRHLTQEMAIVQTTIASVSTDIMLICNVPPQSVGKNINSERLASSNRLTEMALTNFNTYVRRLRRAFKTLLDDYSITFGPCMTEHTLNIVGPFLTTRSFINLMGCCYDLPAEAFSASRIAARPVEKRAGAERTGTKTATKPTPESQRDLEKRA